MLKTSASRREWPGESPVLAQRAASEGPRWTRAVGDQAGHVPYVSRADEKSFLFTHEGIGVVLCHADSCGDGYSSWFASAELRCGGASLL